MNSIYDPNVKTLQFAKFLNNVINETKIECATDTGNEFQFTTKQKSELESKHNTKVVGSQSKSIIEEDLEINCLNSSSDSENEYQNIEPVHKNPVTDTDVVCAAEITFENSDVSVFIQDRIAMKKVQLSIRRHESFKKIFNHFAKMHQLNVEDIYLDYEGQPLSANDTVYSINYQSKYTIDVTKRHKSNSFDPFSTKNESTKKIKHMISLKFQCLKSRRPIMISFKTGDLMKVGMAIACEKFQLDPRQVRFYFDGDKVLHTDTPKSLDLTDGDIIDIKNILSKNDSSISE